MAGGSAAVLARDLDAAAEVDRPPLQLGLVELPRKREGLVRVVETEALVAGPGPVFDRGLTEQRAHAHRRGLRRVLERIAEPAPRLRELDPPQPERPDARAETERGRWIPGEQRLERGPEVAAFGIKS